MTLNLPLQLPYPGATSLADAAGQTVAECRDAETAAVILGIANAAWRLALAEQGSVLAWRARHADLLGAVGAAGEGVPQ